MCMMKKKLETCNTFFCYRMGVNIKRRKLIELRKKKSKELNRKWSYFDR